MEYAQLDPDATLSWPMLNLAPVQLELGDFPGQGNQYGHTNIPSQVGWACIHPRSKVFKNALTLGIIT